MRARRTFVDIHSKTPRTVRSNQIAIQSGNRWALLLGINYKPGYHYRMIRDRRNSRGYSEWLIAESKDWGKDHLRLVKEVILKNAEDYGFSICCVVENEEQNIRIKLYPQESLELKEVEVIDKAGLYIYRSESRDRKPYGIQDLGSELVVLTGRC